jgi:hypothetical protein
MHVARVIAQENTVPHAEHDPTRIDRKTVDGPDKLDKRAGG